MTKDGRRNALVKDQKWVQLVYIDVQSFNDYLKALARTFDWSIYYFSGMSEIGTVRVDSNPDLNANVVMDAFEHMLTVVPGSVPLIFEDAPFILYNPNGSVIRAGVRRGDIPESVLKSKYFVETPKGNFGWRINQWQKDMWNLVEEGGIFVTKRPTTSHTQVLTNNPKMFYVHDQRSFAHIVRIDRKFNWKKPDGYEKLVKELDDILLESIDEEKL